MIFLLRFQSLPEGGIGSALVFLPMGVVASLGLGILLFGAGPLPLGAALGSLVGRRHAQA